MKTSTIKQEAPKWLLIDAEGKTIGKVAVKAATILRGKHKVTFPAPVVRGPRRHH